jgi:hypothetical protein
MGTEKYDVFVSYSHLDKDWVRNYLLPVLRSWELSIAIDHSDFLPGDQLMEIIPQIIKDSRHVIFVCTKNFSSSEWCKKEILETQSSAPEALMRKAIPLVLDSSATHDLSAATIWCDLSRSQNNKDEWMKLCRSLQGKWTDESTRVLEKLFDVSGFLGGYLNNETKTCVIARSHGSKYQGVEEALGLETAFGFANIYSLLSRHGKTQNIELILSNDEGETSLVVPNDTDTNFIFIGGTAQATELIARIAKRDLYYVSGERPHYRFGEDEIELGGDLTFFIYKTRTTLGNNLMYLFSPFAIGSQTAAKTINESFMEFAKADRSDELFYVFNFGIRGEIPVRRYKHISEAR